MELANRAPRVEARKRKTFVFKTSSRAVMNPKKNAMKPVDVTFTNCAPNTSDTKQRSSDMKTKVDERYNIEVTGRAKRLQETGKAYVARSRVVIG